MGVLTILQKKFSCTFPTQLIQTIETIALLSDKLRAPIILQPTHNEMTITSREVKMSTKWFQNSHVLSFLKKWSLPYIFKSLKCSQSLKDRLSSNQSKHTGRIDAFYPSIPILQHCIIEKPQKDSFTYFSYTPITSFCTIKFVLFFKLGIRIYQASMWPSYPLEKYNMYNFIY